MVVAKAPIPQTSPNELFPFIIIVELAMSAIEGTNVCLVLLQKSMVFLPIVVEVAGNNITEVYVLNFSSR